MPHPTPPVIDVAAPPAATGDEPQLVARAAGGDHGAFAVLHSRYQRLVASVVYREVGRRIREADREDLVQEVFAVAWQRLGDLREPSSFKPWLLQITRRTVIDHGRRAGRRPDLDSDDEAILDTTADAGPGPDDLAELADLTRRLNVTIDGLSRRDATAITLAVRFRFGPAEIGEALGITPDNAKVVLHRARARLRAALDEQ